MVTIGRWLGHANVSTTSIYAEVDLESKRQAVRKAKPLLNTDLAQPTGSPTPTPSVGWRACKRSRLLPSNVELLLLKSRTIRGLRYELHITHYSTFCAGGAAQTVSATAWGLGSHRSVFPPDWPACPPLARRATTVGGMLSTGGRVPTTSCAWPPCPRSAASPLARPSSARHPLGESGRCSRRVRTVHPRKLPMRPQPPLGVRRHQPQPHLAKFFQRAVEADRRVPARPPHGGSRRAGSASLGSDSQAEAPQGGPSGFATPPVHTRAPRLPVTGCPPNAYRC